MLRNRLFWVGISAVLISCGGSKGAAPENAGDESVAGDETAPSPEESAASEESAEPEAASAESEASAPEQVMDTEDAETEASDHTVPTEDASPQSEALPSDDLQAYVGAKTYTPEYRTVTENMDSIKQCYLDAMRATPDLQGTIKVRFTVNKAGKVIKASAPVNELNDQVANCIFSTLKKIKFPKRTDKRTVEYPFKFIPAQ